MRPWFSTQHGKKEGTGMGQKENNEESMTASGLYFRSPNNALAQFYRKMQKAANWLSRGPHAQAPGFPHLSPTAMFSAPHPVHTDNH